jgi:Stress responsive A/B Barrel Domain
MIRHSVLITVKPDATTEQIDQLIESTRSLERDIPLIRQWEVGLGLNPNGATVGIVGLFDNLDDYAAYYAHPAHKACAQDYIVPIMASGVQVQFEV